MNMDDKKIDELINKALQEEQQYIQIDQRHGLVK